MLTQPFVYFNNKKLLMNFKNRFFSIIVIFTFVLLNVTNAQTPTPPSTPAPAPSSTPSPSPSSTPTSSASPAPSPSPTPSATPSSSPAPSSVPIVSMGSAPTVYAYSAILNGIINAPGDAIVTNRGFLIGTSPGVYIDIDKEVNLTGYPAGNFSINSTGYNCNTTYYYVAYATNSFGQGRSSESSFTTSPCSSPSPEPTTSPSSSPEPTSSPDPFSSPVLSSSITASSVTKNSVVLSGTITTGPVTNRGFQYGLTSSYGSTVMENSSSAGAYSMSLSGLVPGTVYYYRAFASNSSGLSVSPGSTFTTNASPTNLVGWAWSSNIGWIKLDPITINQTTGDMGGYAWSPNIGWIKFGGLSGMPSGSAQANINFNTGEIKGWARACSGTVGGDCSSMTARSDGWDGWIELAGTNHPSLVSGTPTPTPSSGPVSLINVANAQSGTTNFNGLSMNVTTGQVTGMAWGGPVIGWLSFNADADLNTTPFSASCTATDLGASNVKFTARSTGGSGNYEYEWNNDGTWTRTNSFTKAYILGGGPVSVSLKAREVGQTSFTSPSPACTFTPPSNTPITFIPADPVCNVSPTRTTTGRAVTFSVTADPQPSSGEYSYTWYPGNGDTQPASAFKTKQYTYATSSTSFGYPGGYPVQVAVTNTLNNQSVTKSCGNVIVENPSLDLYIGGDAVSAKLNKLTKDGNRYYVTRVGRSFSLVLDNTLEMQSVAVPDGYTCDKNTTYTPGNTDWENLDENQTSSSLNMAASVIGEYKFTISCTSEKPGNTAKLQTAILKIISSSEKEI